MLHGYAQVPYRVQYFYGTGISNEYYIPSSEDTVIPSVVTEEEWDTYIAPTMQVGSQSTIYRDMGKEVTVVNSSGQVVDKYCLVRFVNGPGSEGVPVEPDEYSFYVKVWTARGDGSVTVVRTG